METLVARLGAGLASQAYDASGGLAGRAMDEAEAEWFSAVFSGTGKTAGVLTGTCSNVLGELNPDGESQRDSISQPRVASSELPWESPMALSPFIP